MQLFDELKADPSRTPTRVYDFLGVRSGGAAADGAPQPDAGRRPAQQAGAAAAKSASQLVKRLGLPGLRSRVKRSARVRQALYRPYADDRPTLDPAPPRGCVTSSPSRWPTWTRCSGCRSRGGGVRGADRAAQLSAERARTTNRSACPRT